VGFQLKLKNGEECATYVDNARGNGAKKRKGLLLELIEHVFNQLCIGGNSVRVSSGLYLYVVGKWTN
jgi:hypothetical protein